MKFITAILIGGDVFVSVYCGFSGDHLNSSIFAGMAVSIYLIGFK